MPKQKLPKGAAPSSTTKEITDPRFANFTTDPRFRLPSKKGSRTKLDSRFSRMLVDDDFSKAAKVDRYGRKLNNDSKKKVLERLYEKESEGEDDEDEDQEHDREGGVEVEVEEDDVVEKELARAEKEYDPARGGGFSSSEDEDEDDEDDEVAIGIQNEEAEEEFPDMAAETAGVEMGEISSRFAVVNLDWDNIRSVDLMAVFESFAPTGGRVEKVSVYPSEFGKERMDREELEGPPKEIFARKEEEEKEEDDSEDEDDEEVEEKIRKDLQKADDGKEFDGAALRQYQLERLRYYYAVVECSDNDTAQKIYEATDGTEYLSSANFFDIRFIPEGVEFDDKPRDECDSVPGGYRPTEFVTDALQHSKVKLTWDTNPEEGIRKDAIKRAFSGSRTEIGENDLRAYLGSDSEDYEEEEDVEEDAPKLSKKEAARQKMRAALGLADEPEKPSKKSSGPVGDMEVTFTAGLTSNEKGTVFENEPITETTAERYVRLERERKARRKEKAKAKREGRDPDAEVEKEGVAEQDLGFDDPFFAADEAVKEKASKTQRKEERLKKRAAKAAEAAEKESNRAGLERLMADNGAETAQHLDHFDINEISRAEKAKKKKKGKKSKEIETGKRGGLQEGFEMDVGDSRFSKLYESHEFAIDPSNPKFKGTEGMKKLLEEGRKKREVEEVEEVDEVSEKKSKKRKDGDGDGELSGLVQKLKKKAKR